MLEFRILAILIIICYLIYFLKKGKRKNFFTHLFNTSLLIYISAVIKLTLFPIPIQQSYINILKEHNYLQHNFIPFEFLIANQNIFSLSIIGNLVLLAPLGIFLPFLSNNLSTIKVALIGFLTSLTIETTQLVISLILGFTYRTFNVDDLILNTTGIIFVYLLFNLFLYVTKKHLNTDFLHIFHELKNKK